MTEYPSIWTPKATSEALNLVSWTPPSPFKKPDASLSSRTASAYSSASDEAAPEMPAIESHGGYLQKPHDKGKSVLRCPESPLCKSLTKKRVFARGGST